MLHSRGVQLEELINPQLRRQHKQSNELRKQYNFSGSYLCTDVTVLLKNPTNTIIHINNTLFTMVHPYMFQTLRGHPQGVLINFASRVNKIRVLV